MHYTIELLVAGNRAVMDYYQAAIAHWQEIWARPESNDVVKLATMLSGEQMWFERNCGPRDDRWIGQEIMVLAGIGMLYTAQSGFGNDAGRARRLYDAFQRSFCSLEVKGIARRTAESYDLLEEQVA